MTREIEALAADALAGPSVAGHGPGAADTACANCGRRLHGRYCSHCGQSSDLRHRSITHLLWEAIEGLFHLDGRLWRTLPALFFRPGTLGKDYLEGRVARHVPPFRMFLIALVIFIFAAERQVHEQQQAPPRKAAVTVAGQPVHGRADAAAKIRRNAVAKYAERIDDAARRHEQALARPDERGRAEAVYQRALRTAAAKRDFNLRAADALETGKGGSGYFRGLGVAMERPQYFLTVMFDWAHRLAVLLLPIVAGYLTLFYAYKRRFYVYDHLIVAMDYLSFLFLIYSVAFLLPRSVGQYALLGAFLWSPVNLFMTLRGAYGSSILGAALKGTAIALATAVSFGLLVIGLLVFTLYQL